MRLMVDRVQGIFPVDDILKEHINIETGSMNLEDNDPSVEYLFYTRNEGVFHSKIFTHDKDGTIVAGEGNFMPRYVHGKFALHQRAYCISSADLHLSNPILYQLIEEAVPYLNISAVGSTVKSLRKFSFETIPFRSKAPYESITPQCDSLMNLILKSSEKITVLKRQKEILLARYF